MLKKLKIALLATLLAFSFTFFGVVQAQKNWNSSKSNTSSSKGGTPDTGNNPRGVVDHNSSRSNLSQRKVPVSKGTKQNDAAKDKKEKSSKNYNSSRPKGK